MIFILFAAALIAAALYYRLRTHDAADYYLAGRKLSAIQVGLSMAATSFGSSAILIASQHVYTRGLGGIWFSLAVGLGFAACGMWFAARIRATGAHSLADFMGRTHGPGVRRLVSAMLVVVQIGFFALTVKSFSLLTKPALAAAPWMIAHPNLYLALVCGVFVLYPLLGGQRADVFSNMIKIVAVALILFVVLLPLALSKAAFNTLPKGWLGFPFSPGAGRDFFINNLILMGLPGIIGGDVFALILSARDERAARRGMLLAGGVRVLMAIGIAALALAALAMPASILPHFAADQNTLSIPLLAQALLPGALYQILLLVFLLSLMATGDTVLLTASTVLALDVLRVGERSSPMRARLITLGLAACGLTLALRFDDLLTAMTFSYTLLCAGIIMPALAMLIARRGEENAAMDASIGTPWVVAAMLGGVAAAAAWRYAQLHMAIAPGPAPSAAPGTTPALPFPWTLEPVVAGVAISGAISAAGWLVARRNIPKPHTVPASRAQF